MSDVIGAPVEVHVSSAAHEASAIRKLAERSRAAARVLAPASLQQRNEA